MSKVCQVCGKKHQVGNYVSHSNKHNKRRFKPNLHRVRAQLSQGRVQRIRVCSRCLRSGAVVKPMAKSA